MTACKKQANWLQTTQLETGHSVSIIIGNGLKFNRGEFRLAPVELEWVKNHKGHCDDLI